MKSPENNEPVNDTDEIVTVILPIISGDNWGKIKNRRLQQEAATKFWSDFLEFAGTFLIRGICSVTFGYLSFASLTVCVEF